MPLTVRRTRGASLIEVLLALALVSLGTLSAAMLQLSARRTQAESLQRARATELAQDLAAQLRSLPAPATLLGTAAFDASAGLPDARACVSGPADGDGNFRVVIAWRGLVPQLDDGEEPCARDPQPDGSRPYSLPGRDNALRRTLRLPLTIAVARTLP